MATADSRPRSVLVVDDEPLIRWSIRTQLVRAGYRVLLAATGEEALARFGGDVDLVLLDVRLPDQDGLDVLREMKRRRGDCRIIVMTAHGGPALTGEAHGCGAHRVLAKPFDLEQMAAAVGDALGGTEGGARWARSRPCS